MKNYVYLVVHYNKTKGKVVVGSVVIGQYNDDASALAGVLTFVNDHSVSDLCSVMVWDADEDFLVAEVIL